MRYLAIFSILLTLLLANNASACKCWSGNDHVWERTEQCCKHEVHGVYDEAKRDCVAHSIAEKMSKFNNCCWFQRASQSDCKH